MASQNPFYEMLGGYYPGEPIPRKKPTPGNLPEARFIDPEGIINDYLEEVRKELKDYTVSAQAKKLFISDLEKQLTMQVQPQDKKVIDKTRSLEYGDEEDLGGVQLKLDIAPWKWAQDPQGMAKKTVETWVKDFANWQDFSTYFDLTTMWDPLLKGEEVSPLISYGYEGHPDKEGYIKSDFKPFQQIGLNEYHTQVNYLKDENGNIIDELERKVDLNKKNADDFNNFIRSVRATSTRNSSFNEYVGDATWATVLDLKESLIKGVITNPEEKRLAENFILKAQALKLTKDFMGDGDRSVYKLSDGSKITGLNNGVGNLTEEIKKASLIEKEKSLDKVEKRFTELFGKDERGTNSLLNEYENKISKIKQELLDNSAPSEKANILKMFKPIEDMTTDFKNLPQLEKIEDTIVIRNIKDKYATRNLGGHIDFLLKEKYTRQGSYKGGIDRLYEHLANNLAEGPIAEIIYKSEGMNGAKNRVFILNEVLRKYRFSDFGDLIEQLEKKGLLGFSAEIAWSMLRTRLDGFTPAAVAKETLDKMHWFGLKYVKGGKHYKFADDLINSPGLARVFNNKQTIKFDFGGKSNTFEFIGDSRLETPLKFFKFTRSKDDYALDNMGFLNLLNGAVVGKAKHKIEGNKEILQYLFEYRDQLRLAFDSPEKLSETKENAELLAAIFGSLEKRSTDPNYVSIFLSKAGLMQKLSSYLNRLQSALGKAFKFLSPISYAKSVVSKKAAEKLASTAIVQKVVSSKFGEAVSKAIAKIFGTVITVATDGLAKPVQKVIEKAIQYLIKKSLDAGEKILKTLKDADFSVIDDFVTYAARAIIKTTGTFVGCCAIVALPFLMIFFSILSGITPVDPTKMAGGGYSAGGARNPGTPMYLECLPSDGCEVVATNGCFNFLEGWPDDKKAIINNSIDLMNSKMGNFVNKVCAAYGGKVDLIWQADVLCGWATSEGQIRFGQGQCFDYIPAKQIKFDWLVAHETGHLYAWGVGYEDIEEAQAKDGGTLPTYVGPSAPNCSIDMNNVDEDFAETASQRWVFSAECTGPMSAKEIDEWWDYWSAHESTSLSKIHGP